MARCSCPARMSSSMPPGKLTEHLSPSASALARTGRCRRSRSIREGPAMIHDRHAGYSCGRDHSTCHDPPSRRRFLVGAGAFVAASVVPGGLVLGQGETRKLIDTHHHFYPPAYQKAWLDLEDPRKIPHFPQQVGWT